MTRINREMVQIFFSTSAEFFFPVKLSSYVIIH
ncbi:hypothetical protein LINGRAHAP2_LOCUS3109 [Linum grandiflorum]